MRPFGSRFEGFPVSGDIGTTSRGTGSGFPLTLISLENSPTTATTCKMRFTQRMPLGRVVV